MSCTLSQESRAMLHQLLAVEKENTRVWFRAEMDRLVDPMLDSIFNRLTHKLTNINGMERNPSGDGCYCGQSTNHVAQFEPPHGQVNQSVVLNVQPSTHLNQQHPNVLYCYLQQNDLNHENSNHHSEMKQFVLPTASNEPIPVNVDRAQILQPFSLTTANEQSKHNSNNQYLDGEYEEDEECDCDECVNGIEVKEEDENYDSVQLIEHVEGEQELPPPVKRQRMDSTQLNNAQLSEKSPRQPIDEAQLNQVNILDRQFITVHLQCPQSDCPETFGENELNNHLMEKHFIGPHRCLVKNCKQSFDNHFVLSEHIKQFHQGTIKWHCSKCDSNFAKYRSLCDHNLRYHQIGQFQCTFPSCIFTGEYKQKVYNHYQVQHKLDLVCHVSGCNYRTKKLARFKAHQRAHLGSKPF